MAYPDSLNSTLYELASADICKSSAVYGKESVGGVFLLESSSRTSSSRPASAKVNCSKLPGRVCRLAISRACSRLIGRNKRRIIASDCSFIK